MKYVYARAAAAALLLTGCAHQVTFDKPDAYTISGPRVNARVTAIIDQNTLSNKVSVRAFTTGIAQSWEIEPGDMLKQVADIELPQMFAAYEFSTTYKDPGPNGVALELALPSYRFEEFHAKVSVSAIASRGKKRLLAKTYSAEGETQGGKMFWGGAFAMKSAIRQSSLAAFKKIFVELRADLARALGRSAGANADAAAAAD